MTLAPTTGARSLTYLNGRRVIAVVRADTIPDAVALCNALSDGGITTVEFTYTTPNVEHHVRTTSRHFAGSMTIGVGTVLTADQTNAAISAGAQFIVTPCMRNRVVLAALKQDVPVLVGALTPTEILAAHEAGASAVKIFPAAAMGESYLGDLRGPFPHIAFVPSGGITASNAYGYFGRGAAAVCVGGSVVAPELVANGQWDAITARANEFVSNIRCAP